jgi:hypothetical protein
VLAGLAGPRLEPFFAPFAPPLDLALSFRRHRYLFVVLMSARGRAAAFLKTQA